MWIKAFFFCFAVVIAILTAACGAGKSPVGGIGKTNIDNVVEIALTNLNDRLLRLTLELYRLNPRELNKVSGMNLQTRIVQIMEYPTAVAYEELDNKQGVEAIKLAFDDSYDGDRVFALMLGVTSMIDNSYNNQKEFYFFDALEPQKIYDTSNNLQTLHRTLLIQSGSNPIITGDESDPRGIHTLLSKASATQELIALIISDRTNRVINKTLQGATSVFLPV